MDTLEGRVAVITGAAGGIGLGMAEALAEAGMRLVLADLDAERLERAAADLGHPEVLTVPTDVSDFVSVQDLAARAVAAFGAVHVVCNNAGVSTMGYQWETPLDDWRWLMGVNLWGVIHGIHAFMPILIEQDEAHVVSTASMGGLMTGAGTGPYSASKAGVIAVSKSLRAELGIKAPHVGVSVVCPGEIATGMPDRIRTKGTPKDVARLDALRDRLTTAMPPVEAGRMVVDAIRARTFWVLPNGTDYLPAVKAELDELLASDD
jgi:NAD(P)-dependent dehydrogenase (short-subunit alcohol dehydrogenase family)